jgi:hypothetical protein
MNQGGVISEKVWPPGWRHEAAATQQAAANPNGVKAPVASLVVVTSFLLRKRLVDSCRARSAAAKSMACKSHNFGGVATTGALA